MHKTCKGGDLLTLPGLVKFKDYFAKTCENKADCKLDMDKIFARDDFSADCKTVYDDRLSPTSATGLKVILFSPCSKEQFVLKVPGTDTSYTISREDIALYVTYFDLGTVLCFLLFLLIV